MSIVSVLVERAGGSIYTVTPALVVARIDEVGNHPLQRTTLYELIRYHNTPEEPTYVP
jgi:hypothetical protein